MKTEHSPTPWRLGEEAEIDGDVDNQGKTIGWHTGKTVWDRCIIRDVEPGITETICSMHQGNIKANAEHIVHCVNQHPALLAALKGLEECPLIAGIAAGIRDWARRNKVADPLATARKLIAIAAAEPKAEGKG